MKLIKHNILQPRLLLAGLFCLFVYFSHGQLDISAAATNFTIDFDNTVTGVNNGAFDGSGFDPAPTAGQLDSDAWAVSGMSDGALNFGDSNTTGDYARGASANGVGSGGFYAFNGVYLGVQPTGSDFTIGELTLRIENNTGAVITSLQLSYDLMYFNDQPRANSFNFSYSDDDVSYITVPALDFTSPEAADASPMVQTMNQATTLTGLNVTNGSFFYIRWTSNDVSGGGSRDELGLDNITVNATNGTPQPVFSFTSSTGSIAENTSPYTATIEVSPAPTSTITVEVSTMDGSALDGADYTGVASQLVTFNTGVTSQTVDIAILDDVILEPDEDFSLVLANNSTGTLLGTDTQVVTIFDNDLTCTVTAGDIIITEIMSDAVAVGDNEGEWFEIYNTTSADIDILGWTIADLSIDSHMINANLVVPAGGYAVLGRNSNTGINGGVILDYEYGNFWFLANTDDEIILSCGATEVDRVEYDTGAGWPNTPGSSKSLHFQNLSGTDNDDPSNWCDGLNDYGGTPGDFGTPGVINDGCPPIYDVVNPAGCSPSVSQILAGTSTWVDFIVNGEIVASVNDMGNNLGSVVAFNFITNIPREDASGTNYLERTLFISSQIPPAGPLDPQIRFYFKDSEFQQLLIDAAGDTDAPAVVSDMMVTQVEGANCQLTFNPTPGNVNGILPAMNAYGNDHYAEFTVSGFSAFYLHGGAIVLPAELGDFTAEARTEDILLNWQTITEENVAHFTIERSINGIDFTTLDQVVAAGNSQIKQDYSFVDTAPVLGNNYYRLKMVDQDGDYDYSNIVSASFLQQANMVVVYHPLAQQIELRSVTTSKYNNLQLYSAMGSVIRQQKINNDNFSINTTGLARGIYYLRLSGLESQTIPVFVY